MRKWIPYPFIRLTTYFGIGIVIQIFYSVDIKTAGVLLCLAIFVYGLCYLFSVKINFYFYASPLGICAFIILFLSGYLRTYQFVDKHNSQHIIHIDKKVAFYEGQVSKPAEENEKTISVEIMVRKVKIDSSWHKAFGKVKLYINKKEDIPPLSYGDLILIRGFANPLKGNLNPGAFDYKAYLESQHIYFTDFVNSEDFLRYDRKGQRGLIGQAFYVQTTCANIISNYVVDPSAQSILLALVLGMKSDMANDLKEAYATAGVMHVLAVSGLHVGIIYGILLFSLGWLKKKKWLFAALCLLSLWAFAFITGFSPSVLRAVTMFSFIIIAKASGRQTNIYNTIAASAFFLLLFNPYFILSVGFQLSYLAVLGIVFLFPKIYPLLDFDNKLLDMIWKLISVSIAAQLAVFPLSTYYFNQFPLYFLLANIILVPSASLILSLGLSLLALNFFTPIASLIGFVLNHLIIILNHFVFWISLLPLSQISNLYISAGQTILLMAILLSIIGLFHHKKLIWMVAITGCFCFFQLITIKRHWNRHHEKQIVYYSTQQSGLLSFSMGGFYNLMNTAGSPLSEPVFNYTIKPHLLSQGYKMDFKGTLMQKGKNDLQKASFAYGSIIVWNGYKLLIWDKAIEYSTAFKEKVKVDVVILEKNAIKSLKDIPESVVFDKLVIGNTYKHHWAVQLMKEAEATNVDISHPLTSGAFIIRWSN